MQSKEENQINILYLLIYSLSKSKHCTVWSKSGFLKRKRSHFYNRTYGYKNFRYMIKDIYLEMRKGEEITILLCKYLFHISNIHIQNVYFS